MVSGKHYLGEIKFKPRKTTLSMQKERMELKIEKPQRSRAKKLQKWSRERVIERQSKARGARHFPGSRGYSVMLGFITC